MMKSEDYPIGSASWKYARRLEEQRGSNYQYWSEELEYKLISSGYKWHYFGKNKIVTSSEVTAKEAVKKHRDNNCYSRIICGVEQNQQRMKMYSVVYKNK